MLAQQTRSTRTAHRPAPPPPRAVRGPDPRADAPAPAGRPAPPRRPRCRAAPPSGPDRGGPSGRTTPSRSLPSARASPAGRRPPPGPAGPPRTAPAKSAIATLTASGITSSGSRRGRGLRLVVLLHRWWSPVLHRMSWRTPDTYQPAGLERGTATSTSTTTGTTSCASPQANRSLRRRDHCVVAPVGLPPGDAPRIASRPSAGLRLCAARVECRVG